VVTNRKGKITLWLASNSNARAKNLTSKYLIDVTFKYFRNYPLLHCHMSKHGAFKEPRVYCKCPMKFLVEYYWLLGVCFCMIYLT